MMSRLREGVYRRFFSPKADLAACMRPDVVGPMIIAGAPLSYWAQILGTKRVTIEEWGTNLPVITNGTVEFKVSTSSTPGLSNGEQYNTNNEDSHDW